MTYARKQLGKQYDLSGAIGSSGAGRAAVGMLPTMANLISPESDFYCSELVAFSYKKAGVPLEWFSSQTTPKDLANNSKLIYVGHLKVSGMNAPYRQYSNKLFKSDSQRVAFLLCVAFSA